MIVACCTRRVRRDTDMVTILWVEHLQVTITQNFSLAYPQ